MHNMAYEAEDFVVTLSAEEYISRFRDPQKFIECCRKCPNYGNSWGCPPFEKDFDALISGYEKVMLTATKIIPSKAGLPLDMSRSLIRPERIRLEKNLRELEKKTGGRAFAYVGSCLYCEEENCSRKEGLPCRHPELVRPSIEAYGFDIGKTLTDLFNIELKWGEKGMMPEYLTLVCGLFF